MFQGVEYSSALSYVSGYCNVIFFRKLAINILNQYPDLKTFMVDLLQVLENKGK